MKDKTKIKRRRFFLKGTSQARLIFKVYSILIFVMLVSNTIFYFIGNKKLEDSYYQAHLAIGSTMDILWIAIIGVSIIGLVSAFVIVLLFTHKIAGPVYRLKLLSQAIKDGELATKISLRSNDQLQELANIVNDILAGIGGKISEIQQEINEIAIWLEGLSRKVLDPEVKGIVDSVAKKINNLKQKAGQFKC